MTCRLCLRDLPLHEGHSLPRWVYLRAMRSAGIGHEPLVRVGLGAAYNNESQRTALMACERCEQRMGRWDDYGAAVSLQLDDTFPALESARANLVKGAKNCAEIPDLDGDRLTRFAASVLWRASESIAFPDVRFGDQHREDFRRYLVRDDVPFPAEEAALVVHLIDRRLSTVEGMRADHIRGEPVQVNLEGETGSRFKVAFFGLEFTLATGSGARSLGAPCFAKTGRVLVTGGDALASDFLAAVATCKPRGKLARE